MGALKIAANLVLIVLLVMQIGLAMSIINKYQRKLDVASKLPDKESFDDYIGNVIKEFTPDENKEPRDIVIDTLRPYVLIVTIPATAFLLIWINVPRD